MIMVTIIRQLYIEIAEKVLDAINNGPIPVNLAVINEGDLIEAIADALIRIDKGYTNQRVYTDSAKKIKDAIDNNLIHVDWASNGEKETLAVIARALMEFDKENGAIRLTSKT